MAEKLHVIERAKDWVVVVKPEGVSSEREGLGRMIADELSWPLEQVYPVHRLDREVRGVMVYALSSKAAAELSRASAERRLEKTYLALAQGAPGETEGRWEDLLYHDARRNKTYVVERMRKGVKSAAMQYRVLGTMPDDHPANETGGSLSLMEIRLETGRTHQIRVQCASRHMPLLHDRRYGGTGKGGIGLFAWKLTFPDPATGEERSYTAPIPEMEKFLQKYFIFFSLLI